VTAAVAHGLTGLGLWACCWATPVLAGDLGNVKLDRDTVTVGDPIRVELRFTAPGTYRAGRVTWSGGKDSLVVLDSLVPQITADSNWLVTTRVALFATGRLAAGPGDILLLGPSGDSLYVLFPPESVTVASVLPAGQDSVAPAPYKALIEPPARIAWWVWVASLLVIASAAYLIYRLRRPTTRTAAPAPPARPPWEVALERLAELAERRHHLRGEPRPFAIALSEVVRTYLEQRFGFPALEQTTHEIMAALRYVELSDAQKDAVHRLLDGCDLAKYANYHWPSPELSVSLQSATRFVKETIPAPVVPQEAS
jgi:hypothetical protein